MIYDLEYFESLLRKYSASSEYIVKTRWSFISEVHPKVVLDYGCGVGWFRAYKPKGVTVDSYDIANFPQTGILHDNYDVVCFWDVLEHIPDFDVIRNLLNKTRYVALSIPIKPENQEWSTWKHFRPFEHLHYFDTELLDAFFKFVGFSNVKTNQVECPPREDVFDILYERKEL